MGAPFTFRQFWLTFLGVPHPTTGALIIPTPHQAQDDAIRDLDAIDPATGLRLYPIHFWDWAKKCAKDFTFMAYVLYHLAFNPFERSPGSQP